MAKKKKDYRVQLWMDVVAEDEEDAIMEFAIRVGEGAYDFERYEVHQLANRASVKSA